MEKKEKDLQIIIDCGKKYKENLAGKQLLIVSSKNGTISTTEVEFSLRNYHHFTGVKLQKNPVTNKLITTSQFINKALNGRLKTDDWEYRKDGTTGLKLKILQDIVEIHKTAKMIGSYVDNRVMLKTDLCIGNIFCYLGMIKTNSITRFDNNVYVPNTVINKDIREDVREPEKIIAIYRKNKTDKIYQELTYLAKGESKQDIEYKIIEYLHN
ncbi:PBECR4 domain-containing protein [Peptoniphilus vaginalis]|uniref:PBECR4 domain-containing protein n=1 Tax=Peptoniphilus vaginalis TaxID=1756987 RepID=UPI000A266DC6|nr:PBECR4 domain-containing protein [Peptoniphilus vaginalis]